MKPRRKAAPLSGDLLARNKAAQRSGLVLSDGGPVALDPEALTQAVARSTEAMRRQPDSRFDDLMQRLRDPASGPDWRNPFRAVLLFAIPLAAFLAVFWYVYNQTSDPASGTVATTTQPPPNPTVSTSSALTLPAPAAGPVSGGQSPAPGGAGLPQVAAAPPAPKAPPISVVPPPAPQAAPTGQISPMTVATTTKPPATPPAPTQDKPPPPIRVAKASAAPVSAGQAAPKPVGRYTIQLSSVRSATAARQEWTRLQRAFPELLKDLQPDVRQVTLAQRGTYHRVRAGAFEDRAAARAFCAKLKGRKQGCLVVRR